MNSAQLARLRRAPFGASAALAVSALLGGGLMAQGGHTVPVGGVSTTSSTSVNPRSAKPGEIVWVQTAYLPPATPIQFMVGALRDGFEVVVMKTTDGTGKIDGTDSLQVKVPDWVTWDKPYLMIVTDQQYNPLGSADMFHPTDAQGNILRTGTVQQDPMGGCPFLKGAADEIYFLAGDVKALHLGERVRIVGHVLKDGPCGKGLTLELKRVDAVP
jgi:hypothetical protein